jgi:hypothetical protein
LPLPNAPALAAPRPAFTDGSIPKAAYDKLGQVAGRPATAAGTKAGKAVLVLQ